MTHTLSDDELRELRQLLSRGQEILAKADQAPKTPVLSSTLPAQYAWLQELGDGMPLTIAEALKEYGVKEVAGGANSPVIMGWARETALTAVYTGDAIPWCGLFAAVVCKRARKEAPNQPLWALNWAKFGVGVTTAGLGDVLVYKRDGGGHVNFYVGEDPTHFHGIGGNQSDGVNITRIDKARCVAMRRPLYKNTPAAVKPYHLAASGAVSTNEA